MPPGPEAPAQPAHDYARPVQTEQVFASGSASVGAARRFVTRTVGQWGQDGVEWSAQLIISELATNAVLHAGTPFTVRLVLTAGVLRLEVDDGSIRAPRERHFGPEATTGRGIALVATLSSAWGVSRRPGGKSVWCEIAPGPGGPGLDGEGADEAPDLDAFLGPDDLDDETARAWARVA